MILQGRLYEIAAGIAGLPLDKVRKYRELFAQQGYELPPEPTVQTVQKFIKRPFRKEKVGTALKKRVENLLKASPKKGCGCNDLATKMDSWGIQGCELNREMIISHMVANRDVLLEGLSEWLPTVCTAIVGMIPDAILRQGAHWLLDRAIDDVRNTANIVTSSTHTIRRSLPRPRGTHRSSRGFGSAFKYTGGEIRFIKSAQFQEDIKLLLGKIPPDITAIAGVARSGLSAATMISMYLHLPMLTIRQTMNDVIPTGNGWRLGGTKHVDPKTEKILIVDDTCMTGNSLKAIRPLVMQQFGNAMTATVYCNPLALMKPDIHAVDLGWPHILEWNVFNSILSPTMALDFDGVLCRDCQPWQDDDGEKYIQWMKTAIPLYLPRRSPIPLVVTARLEKYRSITEEWLNRYGIKVNRLVMHPATTLAQRNREDIAAYKARHFTEWASRIKNRGVGPIMFVESCDHQARRIGQLSKMLCVCPHTGNVYS